MGQAYAVSLTGTPACDNITLIFVGFIHPDFFAFFHASSCFGYRIQLIKKRILAKHDASPKSFAFGFSLHGI